MIFSGRFLFCNFVSCPRLTESLLALFTKLEPIVASLYEEAAKILMQPPNEVTGMGKNATLHYIKGITVMNRIEHFAPLYDSKIFITMGIFHWKMLHSAEVSRGYSQP